VSTHEPGLDAASTVGTAAALRRRFDESFAAPAASSPEPVEDLLAIRVGSDPYALLLSQIAGLHVDIKIVPIPSPATQLLGIVGIRGEMAPVYDLAALLSYPPAGNPRWIVFARAPTLVGLAFEAFESHLQVPERLLASGADTDAGTGASRQHLRGVVQAAGALRPIIHLASVVEMLKDRNS
jgi:chemotaxis signal transduction protein